MTGARRAHLGRARGSADAGAGPRVARYAGGRAGRNSRSLTRASRDDAPRPRSAHASCRSEMVPELEQRLDDVSAATVGFGTTGRGFTSDGTRIHEWRDADSRGSGGQTARATRRCRRAERGERSTGHPARTSRPTIHPRLVSAGCRSIARSGRRLPTAGPASATTARAPQRRALVGTLVSATHQPALAPEARQVVARLCVTVLPISEIRVNSRPVMPVIGSHNIGTTVTRRPIPVVLISVVVGSGGVSLGKRAVRPADHPAGRAGRGEQGHQRREGRRSVAGPAYRGGRAVHAGHDRTPCASARA